MQKTEKHAFFVYFILSKDSVGRNMNMLDNWLDGQQALYLVVDEAHHAIAKTYRKAINYVCEKVSHVKVIGLAAAPFRTDEAEKGLLAKIFHDGVIDGMYGLQRCSVRFNIFLRECLIYYHLKCTHIDGSACNLETVGLD